MKFNNSVVAVVLVQCLQNFIGSMGQQMALDDECQKELIVAKQALLTISGGSAVNLIVLKKWFQKFAVGILCCPNLALIQKGSKNQIVEEAHKIQSAICDGTKHWDDLAKAMGKNVEGMAFELAKMLENGPKMQKAMGKALENAKNDGGNGQINWQNIFLGNVFEEQKLTDIYQQRVHLAFWRMAETINAFASSSGRKATRQKRADPGQVDPPSMFDRLLGHFSADVQVALICTLILVTALMGFIFFHTFLHLNWAFAGVYASIFLFFAYRFIASCLWIDP